MGRKKLTYNFVKAQFEKDDYVLLSDEYINYSTRLKYICPDGHEHYISWDNWKGGHRCPYCAGQGKPTIKFVRESFEKCGYDLLTDAYINSDQQLSYTCSSGHNHTMKWNNWRIGRRCPSCKAVNLSIMMTGDGHPNWKGGITPFNKELRNFIKFIGWSRKVLKRDSYTCERCKNRGGKLVAHHIISLSYIRDYFNINTIKEAEKYDILYDTSNGVTLCENCHNMYHKKHRNRRN